WKARLKREQDEQIIREVRRQRMARLQARATALDSPLKVDISDVEKVARNASDTGQNPTAATNNASDLYAAAMKSGIMGENLDPNAQASKEDFFNQDIKDVGYLPNRVVPQMSVYELKRGSVIPATLITGLNSDLPGRITAQVSQNVYDSATGYRLLIPQGAKLFGRYDSKVSFGQERVLVVWTDLIFPNGSTLQIGGMAGTDAEGYGGFKDKVDRHLWRTWSSAALIALIGTGIDMSMPESSTLATQDTASDAVRRNFAESFGRVAEQTISKNLNVQPTIRIRPGYKFNVLVDQDIIFPSAYRDN
ncbi:IncP-type conjugal transfer protein TrbI, partial [Sinorhizobium fredii]|uniref:IncP-type conjugal transfer protein TrbI n=2 Tax=Sinorhizobium/Ensifer group TaxID=227292 RepID=UPI000564F4B7